MGQCFSVKLKATCKNSAHLEKKNGLKSHLHAQGGYSGFQVTGVIEGFFGGLKFSFPGSFWAGKFGKYFLG